MARKAIKDTYGYETMAGTRVRRRVVAGQRIPDHYEIEDGTFTGEVSTGVRVIGETASTPTQTVPADTEPAGDPDNTEDPDRISDPPDNSGDAGKTNDPDNTGSGGDSEDGTSRRSTRRRSGG